MPAERRKFESWEIAIRYVSSVRSRAFVALRNVMKDRSAHRYRQQLRLRWVGWGSESAWYPQVSRRVRFPGRTIRFCAQLCALGAPCDGRGSPRLLSSINRGAVAQLGEHLLCNYSSLSAVLPNRAAGPKSAQLCAVKSGRLFGIRSPLTASYHAATQSK